VINVILKSGEWSVDSNGVSIAAGRAYRMILHPMAEVF
jgi:hypothetical protein